MAALRGCDLMLHAGDVGDEAVLDGLRTIAPTQAIRGNVDTGAWAHHLPPTDLVEVGGLSFYLFHNVADLDLDPTASRRWCTATRTSP